MWGQKKIEGVVLGVPGRGHALLAVPRARTSLKCPNEELVGARERWIPRGVRRVLGTGSGPGKLHAEERTALNCTSQAGCVPSTLTVRGQQEAGPRLGLTLALMVKRGIFIEHLHSWFHSILPVT